jgi:replicative DNA helicase
MVLFLHRHQVDLEDGQRPEVMDVDLLIEKHRNGPTGEIPMHFHTRHVTYTEVEQMHSDAEIPAQEGMASVSP